MKTTIQIPDRLFEEPESWLKGNGLPLRLLSKKVCVALFPNIRGVATLSSEKYLSKAMGYSLILLELPGTKFVK